MDRRQALGTMFSPVAAAFAASMAPVRHASGWELAGRLGRGASSGQGGPDDEDFWRTIRDAFTVDGSIVNLNNAGVSPAPQVVQDSMARHLQRANSVPPPIALWREGRPLREQVREQLAELCGADAEEIAITRNTTEGLHICQHGFDLSPGDEVLASDQDYPRMLNAFRQRERRHGVRLVTVPLPVPAAEPAEIVRRYEQAITARTRLILVSHVVNLTGDVLPVAELCVLGERHGVPVIVDGAHAVGQLPVSLRGMGCRFYGSSLHKWLFAPHGTGLLFVKRAEIEGLWPLFAENPGQEKDIRKFEEIGTQPMANLLAISEALSFHRAIGGDRKLARLRYLRDRFVDQLTARSDRVRLQTHRERAGAVVNVAIDGLDPVELSSWLWSRHRVLTVAITHSDCTGLRVSPSVYTTPGEIDRAVELVGRALRDGVE